MTRDEVISGLEKCAASECNEKCPYNGINYGCKPRLMLDAVELLKDQETVFEADGDGYVDGELVFDEWYCHACGYHFPDDDMPTAKYCPECGRKFRGNEFKASNLH